MGHGTDSGAGSTTSVRSSSSRSTFAHFFDFIRLDVANARSETLYAKQGRLGQFTTAAERDAFLKGEIKSIKEFQKQQSQALKELRTASKDAGERLSELETQEAALRESLQNRHQQLKELEDKITAHKDEKARLTERRKQGNP